MSQIKAKLPAKPTYEELEREIGRLSGALRNMTARLAAAESAAGASIPMLAAKYGKHTIRVLLYQGRPVLLGEDVVKVLRADGVITGAKVAATQELYRLKLGATEVLALRTTELAEYWGVTGRTLSGRVTVSVRAQFVGLVTERGIEALTGRDPKFCAWVEKEAFPAVLERFGKGGAS